VGFTVGGLPINPPDDDWGPQIEELLETLQTRGWNGRFRGLASLRI